MNASDLTAYCKNLSSAELIAHLNSLVPLVASKSKGSKKKNVVMKKIEDCESVPNKKAKDFRRRFHNATVGTKVYMWLHKLYSENQLRKLDRDLDELLRTTSVGATIIEKQATHLVLEMSVVKMYVQCSPYQFAFDTLVNRPVTGMYLTSKTVTDQIHQLCNESSRTYSRVSDVEIACNERYTVTPKSSYKSSTISVNSSEGASSSREWYAPNHKPTPVVVQEVSEDDDSSDSGDSVSTAMGPTTVEDVIEYSESTKKHYHHFMESAVGNKQVFKLSSLYSVTQTEKQSAADQKILQDTSVTARIVHKEADFVVLKICGLHHVHVRLNPVKFENCGHIFTSVVHLNRKALTKLSQSRNETNKLRLRAIVRLIRHSALYTDWGPAGQDDDALSEVESAAQQHIEFNSRSEARLVNGNRTTSTSCATSVASKTIIKSTKASNKPTIDTATIKVDLFSHSVSSACRPVSSSNYGAKTTPRLSPPHSPSTHYQQSMSSSQYLPPPHVAKLVRSAVIPHQLSTSCNDGGVSCTAYQQAADIHVNKKRKVYQGSSSEEEE